MKILNYVSKVQKKLLHMSLQPVYMNDDLKHGYTVLPLDYKISGKNAVITGGGSGIGFAIAQMLISQGCNVIIVGSNEDKLKVAAQQLRGNVYFYCWNLKEIKEIERNYMDICEFFESREIDIWINCHGIYSEYDNKRAFKNVPTDAIEKTLKLNCESIEKLTDFVAKKAVMEKQQRMHILNISSICASLKTAVYTPYGLSKAGIMSLTRNMARKYENRGIVINAIAPGTVATKFIWNIDKNTNIAYAANIIKRFILPEEIAALALMMVSSYGNELNGAVITASACERI